MPPKAKTTKTATTVKVEEKKDLIQEVQVLPINNKPLTFDEQVLKADQGIFLDENGK